MLKHIFKHCLWWPLEFILRPYSILDRVNENEFAELISALIGGSLWGTLVGYLLQLTSYGDISSIWIIASASASTFTVAFTVAFAGSISVSVSSAILSSVFIAVLSAVAFIIADAAIIPVIVIVIVIVIVTAAVVIAGTGVFPFTVAIAIYFTVILLLGIAILSAELGEILINGLMVGACLYFIFITIDKSLKNDYEYKWVKITQITIYLFLISLMIFKFLPSLSQSNHTTTSINTSISISIISALVIGFLSGLFNILISEDKTSGQVALHSLSYSYLLLIVIPVLVAWFNPWGSDQLQEFLRISIVCLLAIVVLFSGLLFYPVLSFFALFQFRLTKLKTGPITFSKSLPFICQTFVWRLPRLDNYLLALGKDDISSAYQAMRSLQERSFQGVAATKAARKLLASTSTLTFTGFIAQKTNIQTLLPLWQASNFSRSVIVLQPLVKYEMDKYLVQLYIYSLNNSKKNRFSFIRSEKIQDENTVHYSIWEDLNQVRQQSLKKRIEVAQNYLASTDHANDKKAYQNLLDDLLSLASVKDFQVLSHTVPRLKFHSASEPEWLKQRL